jgi:hypothetical protein
MPDRNHACTVSIINETGVASQSLSIKFSREWLPSEGLSAETRLPIKLQFVPVLEQASTDLRKQDDQKPELIVGRITSLETEGNPSDLLEDKSAREIVISWDSGDLGLVRVQVLLAPSDYLTALEAHKAGAFVQVSGVLERSARKYKLQSPSGFAILGRAS